MFAHLSPSDKYIYSGDNPRFRQPCAHGHCFSLLVVDTHNLDLYLHVLRLVGATGQRIARCVITQQFPIGNNRPMRRFQTYFKGT